MPEPRWKIWRIKWSFGITGNNLLLGKEPILLSLLALRRNSWTSTWCIQCIPSCISKNSKMQKLYRVCSLWLSSTPSTAEHRAIKPHNVCFQSFPLHMSCSSGSPCRVLALLLFLTPSSNPMIPIHTPLLRTAIHPRHIPSASHDIKYGFLSRQLRASNCAGIYQDHSVIKLVWVVIESVPHLQRLSLKQLRQVLQGGKAIRWKMFYPSWSSRCFPSWLCLDTCPPLASLSLPSRLLEPDSETRFDCRHAFQ